MTLYDQIQEVLPRLGDIPRPEVAVILGSGLGEWADSLEEIQAFPYSALPHFHVPSVAGHAGRLLFGRVRGRRIVVLQGRFHFYEGYPIEEVVFPVQLLCSLGIGTLLLTNAAGGINQRFHAGDLMVITDHINLMGVNPLRGPNDQRLGPRFPDMSRIYDSEASETLKRIGRNLGIPVQEGVYAAMSGPSYETPAEIRMLSRWGADAVGMSTVPEAIVARQRGVKVAGISCITNLAAGISPEPLSHKEVVETADRVKRSFMTLLTESVPLLG